tara:strand:- start:1486 stop:2241 length:756 start_codon:yes stop_codon:yes gene_type:complete
MKNSILIIPAAGSGSRLKSEIPKIFTPIDSNKTIFELIIKQAVDLVDTIQLILSPDGVNYMKKESIQLPKNLNIVIQKEPTGMFDAIDIALNKPQISNQIDKVIIQWGDQPFIDQSLYTQILQDLNQFNSSIPLIWTRNPYVQFKFLSGNVSILESREGDTCDDYGFKDIGIFAFRYEKIHQVWDAYKNIDTSGNVTGEKSFLKLLMLFQETNSIHWRLDQPSYKGLGINTPDELAESISFMEQLNQLDIK